MTANKKDLISGLVFVVLGLLFALGTRDLDLGTATRMGPGYFPLFLAAVLVLIGLIVAAKSLGKQDGPLGGVPVRAMVLILGATLFFGYAVRGVGLIPAVFLVALASSFASTKMTVPLALLLSVILAAFCYLVFITGLGLPLPGFGPWVRFW